MINSLSDVDAALRREADELLARNGLRSELERFGTVHVSGSYALRLMTWRDLDVYLEAPTISIAEFFELGGRVAALLDAGRMHFKNNRSRTEPEYPAALYWGVRLGDVRQGAWKLDLWVMDPETCQAAREFNKQIAARLTPESRQIILALKSELWRHPAYRGTITAKTIYDAVLDGGVTDLEGFWSFARSRGSG